MRENQDNSALEARLIILEKNVARILAQLERHSLPEIYRNTRLLSQTVESMSGTMRFLANRTR